MKNCNCVEDGHDCFVVKCSCYVDSITLCNDHSVHYDVNRNRGSLPLECAYTEDLSKGISSVNVSYTDSDCECAGICQMIFVTYDQETGITLAQDAKGNNYEIAFDDVVGFEYEDVMNLD